MDTETFPANQSFSVWGLPGTLIWGSIIAVIYVVTELFTMGVFIGLDYAEVAPAEYENLILEELQFNALFISTSTFVSLFVCGLLMFVAIKLKKNSNLKHYLGLKSADMASIKYWFLVFTLLLVLSDILTLLLGKPIVPEYMTTVYTSTDKPWVLWIALIIAAPLLEELFFRGFLFSGFSSSFLGPIGAIVITAALWATIHMQYDLYGISTIFVMGIILGTTRLKTGSVLLTIGLHSFANLVATVETIIYVS